MLPARVPGAALGLALLLLLPGALWGHDPDKPLEVHKPDLFPGSLRWTGTDERQPTNACFEIYNFGPTRESIAGFFDVRLRVDRFINGTPIFFKEEFKRTQEVISGGGFLSMCFALPLEAGFYRGAIAVDVSSEVDEENEDNNAHARGYFTEVAARPRPNLALPRTSGLGVSPQDAREGFPQFFRVRIVNLGEEASGKTTVVVRDETGVLGTEELRPLARGEYAEILFQTDPSLRAAGTYRAIAVVDPDNLIEESDETDNVASRVYSIPPHPLPDILVKDLRVNGTLLERRALRLEANVANEGNRSAGTTTFRFEIDGVAVANQTLDRLAMGRNHTLVFPFYLTGGNHSLRVVADPLQTLVELNESNNDLAILVSVDSIPIERRYPNLVIDRLSALPDDPGPGEVVVINTYVRNTGEVPSDNATLVLVMDGQRLGEVRVPPILPDRYHSALFEWTNVTSGPHTLRATIDLANAVAEIHEDDNDDTLFLTIQPPRVERPPVNRTPPALPPPTQTPPTPTTPQTRPQNSTTPQPNATRPDAPVEVTQVSVSTRPVPDGLKGRITVGLRNPRLEPMGRLTVVFRIDGQQVKEVLVEGIPPAGLTGTTSGELDLPPGEHTVQVEVRLVGSTLPPVTATERYAAQAGEKDVPGAPLPLLLLALGALALRRRKAHD